MTSLKSRKEVLEAKRRFWKQHIDNWQTGDLSQAEYCRKHHLRVHRFIYWKKKFHAPKASQALVELKIPNVSYETGTGIPAAGIGEQIRGDCRSGL